MKSILIICILFLYSCGDDFSGVKFDGECNSKAVISAKRGDHIEDKVQEHPNHGDMHRERYGPSTNPLTCIAVQPVFPSTCSECNSVLLSDSETFVTQSLCIWRHPVAE